jgi:hypothetical protein
MIMMTTFLAPPILKALLKAEEKHGLKKT